AITDTIDQGRLGVVGFFEELFFLSLKVLWPVLLFCIGWELSTSAKHHALGTLLVRAIEAVWVGILLMLIFRAFSKKSARKSQGGGIGFDIAMDLILITAVVLWSQGKPNYHFQTTPLSLIAG